MKRSIRWIIGALLLAVLLAAALGAGAIDASPTTPPSCTHERAFTSWYPDDQPDPSNCTHIEILRWYCPDCGARRTEQKSAWGDWETRKQATCAEEGTQIRICSNCKKQETRTIKPTGEHTWGRWRTLKAATCGEEGTQVRTCSTCNKQETRTVKPTGEHTWGRWRTLKAATCTKEGTQVRTCSVCDKQESRTVKPTGHTWGNWLVTKQATCGEDGERQRSCKVCGETIYDDIKATGEHKWGRYRTVKAATCVDEGESASVCSVCGKTRTKTIAPTGEHTWGEWEIIKAPTCSKKGTQQHTCIYCGKTEKESIPATGEHTWGKWHVLTKATSSAPGEREHTCSVCGKVKKATYYVSGTIRPSTKGKEAELSQIQQMLKDTGYYTGNISGVYDEATRAAILAFQKAAGVKKADGILYPDTQDRLGWLWLDTGHNLDKTELAEEGIRRVIANGFRLKDIRTAWKSNGDGTHSRIVYSWLTGKGKTETEDCVFLHTADGSQQGSTCIRCGYEKPELKLNKAVLEYSHIELENELHKPFGKLTCFVDYTWNGIRWGNPEGIALRVEVYEELSSGDKLAGFYDGPATETSPSIPVTHAGSYYALVTLSDGANRLESVRTNTVHLDLRSMDFTGLVLAYFPEGVIAEGEVWGNLECTPSVGYERLTDNQFEWWFFADDYLTFHLELHYDNGAEDKTIFTSEDKPIRSWWEGMWTQGAGDYYAVMTVSDGAEKKIVTSNIITIGEDGQPVNKTGLKLINTHISEPANGEYYVLGETVRFEVVLLNEGSVRYEGVFAYNSLVPEEEIGHRLIGCDDFAPGSRESETVEYTVTQEDIESGSIASHSWAYGLVADGVRTEEITCDDVTVPAGKPKAAEPEVKLALVWPTRDPYRPADETYYDLTCTVKFIGEIVTEMSQADSSVSAVLLHNGKEIATGGRPHVDLIKTFEVSDLWYFATKGTGIYQALVTVKTRGITKTLTSNEVTITGLELKGATLAYVPGGLYDAIDRYSGNMGIDVDYAYNGQDYNMAYPITGSAVVTRDGEVIYTSDNFDTYSSGWYDIKADQPGVYEATVTLSDGETTLTMTTNKVTVAVPTSEEGGLVLTNELISEPADGERYAPGERIRFKVTIANRGVKTYPEGVWVMHTFVEGEDMGNRLMGGVEVKPGEEVSEIAEHEVTIGEAMEGSLTVKAWGYGIIGEYQKEDVSCEDVEVPLGGLPDAGGFGADVELVLTVTRDPALTTAASGELMTFNWTLKNEGSRDCTMTGVFFQYQDHTAENGGVMPSEGRTTAELGDGRVLKANGENTLSGVFTAYAVAGVAEEGLLNMTVQALAWTKETGDVPSNAVVLPITLQTEDEDPLVLTGEDTSGWTGKDGDTLPLTLTVLNQGKRDLKITLFDGYNAGGALMPVGDQHEIQEQYFQLFPAGESFSFVYNIAVDADDAEYARRRVDGRFDRVFWITAEDAETGETVSAEWHCYIQLLQEPETVTLTDEPGIRLTVDAMPKPRTPEETQTAVQLTLMNTGKTPLKLNDLRGRDEDTVSSEPWMGALLQPGVEYGFTYTVQRTAWDINEDGWGYRTVQAEAEVPETGETVSTGVHVFFTDQQTGSSMVMTPPDHTGDHGAEGETLYDMEYTVFNNGSTTLNVTTLEMKSGENIGVFDKYRHVYIDGLKPGESYTFTYNVVVSEKDVKYAKEGEGTFHRTLILHAYAPETGELPQAVDSFNVWLTKDETEDPKPESIMDIPLPRNAKVEIRLSDYEKYQPANGLYYVEGETIEYEVLIYNIGYQAMTDLTAVLDVDPPTGETGVVEYLTPGNIRFLFLHYTVQAEDLPYGMVTNRVKITWPVDSGTWTAYSNPITCLLGYNSSATSITTVSVTDPPPTQPETTGTSETTVTQDPTPAPQATAAGIPKPTPAPGAEDRCHIDEATGEILYCEKHRPLFLQEQALLEDAHTEEERLAALKEAARMWIETINAQYEAQMKAMGDAGRETLLGQKLEFFTQAGLAGYDVDLPPLQAAQNMVDLLRAHCAQLCGK